VPVQGKQYAIKAEVEARVSQEAVTLQIQPSPRWNPAVGHFSAAGR
jgi:hypothetical protein